jgi:ankyrin repeat protein
LASTNPLIMGLLLQSGSSIDVRSAEGATPLMNAAQGAALEKAAFLLDKGADPNARDRRGFTALHRAAEMGHLDIAKMLLNRGASPDADAEGHTPRSLAAKQNRADVLALLNTFGSA